MIIVIIVIIVIMVIIIIIIRMRGGERLPENSGFHGLLTHRPPHQLNPKMMMRRIILVMKRMIREGRPKEENVYDYFLLCPYLHPGLVKDHIDHNGPFLAPFPELDVNSSPSPVHHHEAWCWHNLDKEALEDFSNLGSKRLSSVLSPWSLVLGPKSSILTYLSPRSRVLHEK